MSMDICITLSDSDIDAFVEGIKDARSRIVDTDPASITAAARSLVESCRNRKLPEFVAQRIQGLEALIAMVEDVGFGLPEADRERVLTALAYFTLADDAIPDDTPTLGLLDDAIMIELCMRELRHEIEAYEDFRTWRAAEAARRGESVAEAKLNRVDWAEACRAELIERMHRRREQSYVSGEWPNALFRIR